MASKKIHHCTFVIQNELKVKYNSPNSQPVRKAETGFCNVSSSLNNGIRKMKISQDAGVQMESVK